MLFLSLSLHDAANGTSCRCHALAEARANRREKTVKRQSKPLLHIPQHDDRIPHRPCFVVWKLVLSAMRRGRLSFRPPTVLPFNFAYGRVGPRSETATRHQNFKKEIYVVHNRRAADQREAQKPLKSPRYRVDIRADKWRTITMKILILWAGIAAFVLIGLFPPMTQWEWPYLYRGHSTAHDINIPVVARVDSGRLAGRLAVVVAITGGLLWTEAQVRPWIEAGTRRRIVFGVAAVVVLSLATVILMEWWGLAGFLRGLLGLPR